MKIKGNFNKQELVDATNEIYESDFGSLKYSERSLKKIKKFVENSSNQVLNETFDSIKTKLFKNVWKKER